MQLHLTPTGSFMLLDHSTVTGFQNTPAALNTGINWYCASRQRPPMEFPARSVTRSNPGHRRTRFHFAKRFSAESREPKTENHERSSSKIRNITAAMDARDLIVALPIKTLVFDVTMFSVRTS